jgi:hypothetical protein
MAVRGRMAKAAAVRMMAMLLLLAGGGIGDGDVKDRVVEASDGVMRGGGVHVKDGDGCAGEKQAERGSLHDERLRGRLRKVSSFGRMFQG